MGYKVGEEKRNMKVHKETLGNDGYVHYIDCGDGFIDVYMCQDISNSVI